MKIIKAEMAGFCFGVKRALELTLKEAREGSGVYTLGPLIHNPQVVNRLREEGVEVLEISINSQIPSDLKTVVIRTHGVTKEINEHLYSLGVKVVDATCPFVKKAQQYAKLLHEEGYQVIILGNPAHPEVVGIKSYAGPDSVVITDPEELKAVHKRVGVVVQTTQPVERLQRLLEKIVSRSRELKVYNTICNSTSERLKETAEMTKDVDIMLVVGGKNSANTTQLAKLCESLNVRTYHIETADELKEEWFKIDSGEELTVGITAGASTPDWIIEGVIERLKQFN
jgi:4-hydroxy-3-methylbut-2-enyl diphosphate reductase